MRCPVLRSYQAAPLRSAAQSHRSALRVSSWALNPWKWSRNVGNQAAVRTWDLSVRHVALADSAASCGVSCTHLSVDAPLAFVWLCVGLCVRQRLDVRDHLRTIRPSRTSEYISSIKRLSGSKRCDSNKYMKWLQRTREFIFRKIPSPAGSFTTLAVSEGSSNLYST